MNVPEKTRGCPCGADDGPVRSDVVERLRQSMCRRWCDGERPPGFQHAVRDDVPGATLTEFNTAATIAWDDVGRTQ